eukprot:6185635-Pleurochrysis_carterae.AAC.2
MKVKPSFFSNALLYAMFINCIPKRVCRDDTTKDQNYSKHGITTDRYGTCSLLLAMMQKMLHSTENCSES